MDIKSLIPLIDKRRSHRKYSGAPTAEQLEKIKRAITEVRPLYPEIEYKIELVERKNIRSLMPWLPEYGIAFFSRQGAGYLENAGFILAELDLYIQSLGLGSCYVGIAKPHGYTVPEGFEYVMLLTVGATCESLRSGECDFKRKELSEISDTRDPRLTPARLAPSSVNSQPWYFAATDGGYRVYKRKLVRTKGLSRMNTVDVGIALGMLFVSTPDSFSCEREVPAPELHGMEYIATVRL